MRLSASRVALFASSSLCGLLLVSYLKSSKYGGEATVRHVWVTLVRVASDGGLAGKFETLLESILLHRGGAGDDSFVLHVVTDGGGEPTVREIVGRLSVRHSTEVPVEFHGVDQCAERVKDIVECTRPYFSSHPGSYYSDVLFYLSLGMHRIAPENQKQIVLMDCDLKFTTGVESLFEEFEKFSPDNLFGLAHELSSVYRHVLYTYRLNNPDTPFGSEPNFMEKRSNSNDVIENDRSRVKGFPGFNSGVVLLNLERIRASPLYESLLDCSYIRNVTKKYSFKGHLGDQDFFTLLGYERPELFHTLDCGWNRQLCKWWRRYEDVAVFDDYFKCDSQIKVYHGNCNTNIPDVRRDD